MKKEVGSGWQPQNFDSYSCHLLCGLTRHCLVHVVQNCYFLSEDVPLHCHCPQYLLRVLYKWCCWVCDTDCHLNKRKKGQKKQRQETLLMMKKSHVLLFLQEGLKLLMRKRLSDFFLAGFETKSDCQGLDWPPLKTLSCVWTLGNEEPHVPCSLDGQIPGTLILTAMHVLRKRRQESLSVNMSHSI